MKINVPLSDSLIDKNLIKISFESHQVKNWTSAMKMKIIESTLPTIEGNTHITQLTEAKQHVIKEVLHTTIEDDQ